MRFPQVVGDRCRIGVGGSNAAVQGPAINDVEPGLAWHGDQAGWTELDDPSCRAVEPVGEVLFSILQPQRAQPHLLPPARNRARCPRLYGSWLLLSPSLNSPLHPTAHGQRQPPSTTRSALDQTPLVPSPSADHRPCCPAHGACRPGIRPGQCVPVVFASLSIRHATHSSQDVDGSPMRR